MRRDRASEHRPDQQGAESRQADKADVEGGVGQPEDLVRDGDDRQLVPEGGYEVAEPKAPELWIAPEGADVDQPPPPRHPIEARRPSSRASRVALPQSQSLTLECFRRLSTSG